MYNVTITYTAVAAPKCGPGAQICAFFNPNNCAANMDVFDGTYYDTNVCGFGEGVTLDNFMSQMVAHPGLVAAMREAMREGTYTFEADEKAYLFLKECAPVLKDQGITFEFAAA